MPTVKSSAASVVSFNRPAKKHFSAAFVPAALVLGVSVFVTVRASAEAGASGALNVDVSAVEHLRPALPVIPDRTFNLVDFGAVGDGKTMNTTAFKAAIAAVDKAGGGKLIVPGGVFVTCPFILCSSLELHLDGGAVIQAPDTFEAQGLPNPAVFKTQAEANSGFRTQAEGDAVYRSERPLINGYHLHDVALTGTGTIDGSGKHWWDWSDRAEDAHRVPVSVHRSSLVRLYDVERLHVADVTLCNSPMFHLVPVNVTNLTIERVKIRAPFNAPNTDGIDPGPGSNFWIHDCDIDTGDDDIVIKFGGSNILIENNTIKHGHGISIGSATTDGVSNMLVRHCTFDGSDNAIRIKSRRGAGGLVENIRYTDIQIKNVQYAIILQLDYDTDPGLFEGDPTKIPALHNILLDHITIKNSRRAGLIHGIPDSKITNITLRDMTITAEMDFDVRYADQPVFERVDKQIIPGIAPPEVSEEY